MVETSEEKVIKSLKTIEEWALQGMSEKEIAECLNVGYSTFRKIKRENVALIALLRKCAKDRKEFVEEQVKSVETSLFKRATGYDAVEEGPVKLKETYYDDNGKSCSKETIVIVKSSKHVPADIVAAKFFLVNRAKRAWQDNPHKVEVDKEIIKLKQKESERNDF